MKRVNVSDRLHPKVVRRQNGVGPSLKREQAQERKANTKRINLVLLQVNLRAHHQTLRQVLIQVLRHQSNQGIGIRVAMLF